MSVKQNSKDILLIATACLLLVTYLFVRWYFQQHINVTPKPIYYFPAACFVAFVSGCVVKFGFPEYFQRSKSRATWIILNIFGVAMIAGYVMEVHG
jgi:peptidoglycan/LPS O-acetylase OafA/YrhL